jgi:hypothetical protein
MKFFLIFFTLITIRVCAQQHLDFHEHIEKFIDQPDENINYEDWYDILYQQYLDPINLNTASYQELETLQLLNPAQIANILEHRSEMGWFINVYELQVLDDFTLEDIHRILPFIEVNEPYLSTLQNLQLKKGNKYLLIRNTLKVPRSRALQNNNFQGGPEHLMIRFRNQLSGRYSFGFTTEKDPGESIEWNKSQRGMDFISMHAQVHTNRFIRSFLLGDYQIQNGQGLVFGSGFQTGKGLETITSVKRGQSGLRPHTSTVETGFFRGAALTLGSEKLNSSIFYSTLHQDATLNIDTALDQTTIRSIRKSGYHRTASELAARDRLNEKNIGININQSNGRGHGFGINGLFTHFNTPLENSEEPYSTYEFEGTRNWVTSLYGQTEIKGFYLFGEYALSKSAGTGLVLGYIKPLTQRFNLSMIFRNYDPEFHSFYAAGFGEQSRTINEKGIYTGLYYQISRKHKVAMFYDHFRFPWLRYQVNAPSVGNEWLIHYTINHKQWMLGFQVRNEKKQKSDSDRGYLMDTKRTQALLDLDFVNNKWTTQTRLHANYYEDNISSIGWAIIQDLNLFFNKFSIGMRYAFFQTDRFSNAVYAYERDVLYAFSVPILNGEGMRRMIIFKWKPFKSITIQAKYSDNYSPMATLDGNAGITGNRIAQIRGQIMYRP